MQENEIDVTNVQEKGLVGKIKDWSYENWQTILIILIVLIVGVSAYNYNQQGENTNNPESAALLNDESENSTEDSNSNEENISSEQNESSIESSVVSNDQEAEIENTDEKKAESEDNKTEPVSDKNEELENGNNNDRDDEEVLSSDSDVSGKIYTATAKPGDGITHLARHTLEKYLDDINNGSELTKEHKIYIEDFLQNKIGNQKLEIGDQETFSENLIQEAISNAKNLSPKSLENLSKYTKNIK